jgi:[ribosomal protein S18]-alanine N-acetyltransferase
VGSDPRTPTRPLKGAVLTLANRADLAEVARLEGICYADPWPASAFSSLPENPAVHFVVAREAPGEPIVGYAVSWFVEDEGELANLAVAPALRGRGIGAALLDAVLGAARERGTRNLFLEVRASNLAARKLYAAREFVEVGRRQRYYRSPEEDALILRRTFG